VQLGPLYHWSPRERLAGIKRLGLVPGKRNIAGPVLHGTPEEPLYDDDGSPEFLQPGVCFSLDPGTAWNYSHGAWRSTGTFDLWQVDLVDADEVHVLPMWGGSIVEIRVHNRIRKARLRWVGERTVQPKETA
jgi:hypothetical protein